MITQAMVKRSLFEAKTSQFGAKATLPAETREAARSVLWGSSGV